MMKRHHASISTIACALIVLSASLAVPSPGQDNKAAKIVITSVPAYDEKGGPDRTEIIKGTASESADCKEGCRVVVFARTNVWWVQPLADSPYTTIDRNKWETETHLGTEYAALLVRAAYKPAATTNRLPTVGGDILAMDVRAGRK